MPFKKLIQTVLSPVRRDPPTTATPDAPQQPTSTGDGGFQPQPQQPGGGSPNPLQGGITRTLGGSEDFKIEGLSVAGDPGTGSGTSAGPISGGGKSPSTGSTQPTPPVGPIEGGDGPSTPGGGTPTPPSAPFDPNEVVFRTQSGVEGLKVDGLPVVEDPDAGGEVAIPRRPPLDAKFDGLTVAGDPGTGSGTSAGPISGGGKSPSTGSNQPTPPVGPVEGGDGPSTPGGGTPTPPSAPFDPNQVVFRTQSGVEGLKVDGLPVVEDPDAGGEVAIPRRPPLDAKFDGLTVAEDPDAGGEIEGRRRPPLDFKIEDSPVVEDPDAGGEVAMPRRPPLDAKFDGLSVAEDPDAGGEVAEHKANLDPAFTRRLRFGPDAEPSLHSADPEEGGEIAAGRHTPSDIPIVKHVDKSTPILSMHEDGGPTPVGEPGGSGEIASLRRPPLDAKFDEMTVATPTGGSGAGRPEGYSPTSGSGAGRPEGYTPTGGSGAGRPEGVPTPAGETAHVFTSDPQEGGQFTGLDKQADLAGTRAPIDRGMEEAGAKADIATSASADPEEGGEFTGGHAGSDHFNVKIEEVIHTPPAAPPGVPLPYPNTGATDDGGSGFADAIARKSGEGQKDFLKVTMKEAFITRDTAPAVDGESTDTDHKDNFAASRIKFDGVEGESTHQDHKGELSLFNQDHDPDPSPPGPAGHPGSSMLADRTDVKDSHDRFANLVSAQDPDTDLPDDDMPDSDFPDTDDHFESSTLLNLNADSDAHEMLPGLAGDLSDSLDVDFDLDPDADVDADTDESDL